MGASLGRLCPSPPPWALRGPHPPAGLVSPQLARCARGQLLARRARPAGHVPGSTRRPAYKYPASLHQRSVLASSRRYSMIPQTLRSLLGLLTSVCRRGRQQKAMLSAPASQVSCGGVSIVDAVTPRVLQQRDVTGLPPSARRSIHHVSTGERGWRGPGESRKGMAHLEEDPALIERREAPRRDPEGSGAPEWAFRPLGVQGSFSSSVARPWPLQRTLPLGESSEDPLNKKSPSSHGSSCPTQNGITSAYSSTRGCPPEQRRRGLATSQAWRALKPPKKVSQEGPSSPTEAAAHCQRKNQLEKDVDATTTRQRATRRKRSPPADCSRPRKRKIPLLPRRRGEPLRLPPPPELGFRVTAKDLDREKKATLQRFQDALRGDTEAICSCGPRWPSSALALPAAEAAPLPAVPPAPGPNAQRETCGGKRDSLGALAAQSPDASCPTACLAPGLGCAMTSSTPGWPAPAAAAVALPLFVVKPIGGSPLNVGEGGGSLPAKASGTAVGTAVADASGACPGGPRTSRMESPSPLCVDSPAFPSQSCPPTAGPSAPPSTSLPIPSAISSSPSSSTSAGLAPQTASDPQVTPMDCSPPSQPLLLGSPPGSSGSFFPTAQAPWMPSRHSMASVTAPPGLPALPGGSSNPGSKVRPPFGAADGQWPGASTLHSSLQHGQPAARAPDPVQALSAALAQLSLGSGTQATSVGPSPAAASRGARVNPQSGLATSPTVSPPGLATATGLAAAPQMPGAVPHAGPNSRQPGAAAGSTSTAPISGGLSATPPSQGRGDDVTDLCCSFGALSITARTSRAPSGTQGSAASQGPNMGVLPCQSTLSGTAGASTTNHPVSGAMSAAPFSLVPRHLPRQSPQRSSPGGRTTDSKAVRRGRGVQASPPSDPASLGSTARGSLVRSGPSSPAQGLTGCKRAARCNKPSSSTSQSTPLGPKRQMLA